MSYYPQRKKLTKVIVKATWIIHVIMHINKYAVVNK
jgi:hypothetical protein